MKLSDRNFLASQAMYGFMLTCDSNLLYQSDPLHRSINTQGCKKIAEMSAQMADIMIKELDRTRPKEKTKPKVKKEINYAGCMSHPPITS